MLEKTFLLAILLHYSYFVDANCLFPDFLNSNNQSDFRWLTRIQHERDINGRATELHIVSRSEFQLNFKRNELVEYKRTQTCALFNGNEMCDDVQNNGLQRVANYFCEKKLVGRRRHEPYYLVYTDNEIPKKPRLYYCLQFVKRFSTNNNKVALVLAVYKTKGYIGKTPSPCDTLHGDKAADVWLWIPSIIPTFPSSSTCQLKGGYQFVITWINSQMNKVEKVPLCNNKRMSFSWMESECSVTNGFEIEFYPFDVDGEGSRCNPFGITQSTRFFCLASWESEISDTNGNNNVYQYVIIYNPNVINRLFTLRLRKSDLDRQHESMERSKHRIMSTMYIYEGPSEVTSREEKSLLNQNRFLVQYRAASRRKSECDDKLATCPKQSCFFESKSCPHSCEDFNSCSSSDLNTQCQFYKNDLAMWKAIRTGDDSHQNFETVVQILPSSVNVRWKENSNNVSLSCYIKKSEGLYLLSKDFNNGCRRRQLCLQIYTPTTIMGVDARNPDFRMMRFSQSSRSEGNMHCNFENDPHFVGNQQQSTHFLNYIKYDLQEHFANANRPPLRSKCGFFEHGLFVAQVKNITGNCTVLLSDLSDGSREYGGVLKIEQNLCIDPILSKLHLALGNHNCVGILRNDGERAVEMIISQSQSSPSITICWVQYSSPNIAKKLFGFNSTQCGLKFHSDEFVPNSRLPKLMKVDTSKAFVILEKLTQLTMESSMQKSTNNEPSSTESRRLCGDGPCLSTNYQPPNVPASVFEKESAQDFSASHETRDDGSGSSSTSLRNIELQLVVSTIVSIFVLSSK